VFLWLMDELVRDLSRDLDAAFPRLVEHMSPRLYWGLRRMTGDGHQAEDLSQEAFIRTYRALSGYPPQRIRELRLEPWVWTIALNLGRNHLRDRSRRPTLVEETTEPEDIDIEPPDTKAWQRRLDALTGPQREAVILRHVVGFGIPEIAAITGRPEGTCKADIHRGLKKLREIMESEDEA
jgi:RNA polymerase sigma-70 factor (ECF subfamily)